MQSCTKDAALWDTITRVDASLQRLAHHSTLSWDDSVSFKVPILIENWYSFKDNFFSRRGGIQANCSPNLLGCSSQGLGFRSGIPWIGRRIEEQGFIVPTFNQDGNLLFDQVRMMARRALRLKHWSADNSSKHGLCSVPFDGKLLFGKTLVASIQRVSGGNRPGSARKNKATSSFLSVQESKGGLQGSQCI